MTRNWQSGKELTLKASGTTQRPVQDSPWTLKSSRQRAGGCSTFMPGNPGLMPSNKVCQCPVMASLLETCPVLKDDGIRKLPALVTKRWGAGAQSSRAVGDSLGGGSPSQVWNGPSSTMPWLEESLYLSGLQILAWDGRLPPHPMR